MKKLVEQDVVNEIERQLTRSGRYYVNMHGSMFSKNGTADFLTHDSSNTFIGIEAKVDGKSPVVNQWRKAQKMLKSGLRYIIAQSDFNLDLVDKSELPTISIGSEAGDEFELEKVKIFKTTEVVLRK